MHPRVGRMWTISAHTLAMNNISQVLTDVVEEHAEEAAFLWQQRDSAVRDPDFDLDDIM